MVVSSNAALDKQGGYYCKVCDCTVKDSMSWLDHVNGKKHNRALGMNMRVERATVEDVKNKMEEFKNKPDHRVRRPGIFIIANHNTPHRKKRRSGP